MSGNNVQFFAPLIGKRIKLQLRRSSVTGVVLRINSNKSIVLADVAFDNKYKPTGSMLFFGPEILNVEFVCGKRSDSGDVAESFERQPNVEPFPIHDPTALCEEENKTFPNYTVIDEFNERFGPALTNIKKQSVIGVAAEGFETFNKGRVCWLQIATEDKVYLFDILQLGVRAFRSGLSMILESEQILKVIHDCRPISGCLRTQYGVHLTNVFDTQVADAMCFRTETGGFLPNRLSSLEETLSLHLKLPPSKLSPLQEKAKVSMNEKNLWYRRPCQPSLMKLMASAVVYLRSLRGVLLDGLMADFITAVGSCLDGNSYDADELEHADPESVVELPSELRQIKTVQQERRQWATRRYPVVAEGVLGRFDQSPRSSSQTSSERKPTQPPSTVSASKSLEARVNGGSRGLKNKTMGKGITFGGKPSPGLFVQTPPPVARKQREADISSVAAPEISPTNNHKPAREANPPHDYKVDPYMEILNLRGKELTPLERSNLLNKSFISFRNIQQ